MKSLLLSTVFLAAFAAPSAAAILTLQVLDNGVVEGTAVSTNGTAVLRVSTDPAFDIIDVSAAGSPFLPGGDLTSATLNVTSATISTTHNLVVHVTQTGVFEPAGTVQSTFTVNNLVGFATLGATTETTGINGSAIQSHTFPAGTIRDSVGPLVSSVPAITSDDHSYSIAFNAPDQSVQDTIALTSTAHVIPEPSTWVMLGIGFSVMAALGFRKRSSKFLEV